MTQRSTADAAGGSVPVVTSTATPAPCVGSCQKVQPVIAMTDPGLPGTTPRPSAIIFIPNGHWAISQVVQFSSELEIKLSAKGAQETIHLPMSAAPSSSAVKFSRNAKLDSVIGLGSIARVLYHRGSRGYFNAYTVSGPPSMTAP